MNNQIDTTAVKQILSRQQGEGKVLLDAITDIDTRIELYRQEGKDFIYEIVRALLLLARHGCEETKEAAKDCLAEHFLPEVKRILAAFESELEKKKKPTQPVV